MSLDTSLIYKHASLEKRHSDDEANLALCIGAVVDYRHCRAVLRKKMDFSSLAREVSDGPAPSFPGSTAAFGVLGVLAFEYHSLSLQHPAARPGVCHETENTHASDRSIMSGKGTYGA
jgi:hypothetical protein